MHVVLAWFSERPLTPESRGIYRARFEASIRGLVPDTYVRYEIGGDDWGVTMLHPGPIPTARWEPVQSDDRVTAVSLGIPVGVPKDETALSLARRLLAGESVHRDVVPPFSLMAIDRGGEFAVQQDWLGMCRLFAGEAGGITALGTRPSMLGEFLHGKAQPDLEGWASYAVCGHFGGDYSPIRGVRLLSPGERLTGRHRPDGGWTVESRIGYNHDDVVLAGLEAQGRPLDTKLAAAADEFAETAGLIADRWDNLVLGLSGGKDSRLIAASLLAAGRLPRLTTNDDIAEEGETARELVRILREQRGLEVDHAVRPAAVPSNVQSVGLRERIVRLQRRYDFQFPHNYTVRPAPALLLPAAPTGASITGAGGELATGFWYPRPEQEDQTPEHAVMSHLLGPSGVVEHAGVQERERVGGMLRHAKDIGVHDEHLIDYVYLAQSLRRWLSAAYMLHIVTPLLRPSLVSAMFSLTPEQKRDRVLHTGLTQRLVPEWSDVPYVSGGSPTSTVPKIWEGDGVEVMADLLDTAKGPLVELLDTRQVEQMLLEKRPMSPKALQRFSYLAVASHQLEPETVQPSTGATYQRVVARKEAAARRESPTRRDKFIARLQWIKRAPGGNAVWNAARKRIRKGR